MEGAVPEDDGVALAARLEAVALQQVDDTRRGLGAQPFPQLGGLAEQHRADRLAGAVGFLHPVGQQLSGQLVLPGGHAHADLALRAAVELGGPPGARSGLAGGRLARGDHLNLLTIPDYYDIALRDFGLLLGAVALARLAQRHHGTVRH